MITKKMELLVYIGCYLILFFNTWLAVLVYFSVDEWEGHLEGSILPFVMSVLAFCPGMTAMGYIYGRFGRFVIAPLERSGDLE